MRYLLLLAVFFCFMGTAICYGESAAAAATNEKAKVFVDRDGDGFDDSVPDLNGDGIPDPAEPRSSNGFGQQDEQGLFAAVQTLVAALPEFLHNSGSFNHLRTRLSPLTLNRGSFGSGNDFGPGGDIGCGAVVGGACAGGVCGPK